MFGFLLPDITGFSLPVFLYFFSVVHSQNPHRDAVVDNETCAFQHCGADIHGYETVSPVREISRAITAISMIFGLDICVLKMNYSHC